MLILGIDTATRRVGVVLASDRRAARPHRARRPDRRDGAAARRGARARDRVRCASRRGVDCRPAVGDRGRHRPGHVHGAARRRDDGQGARAGAAHPGDPDPEPRPARVPAAAQPGARRARRSTRAATRCTTRSTAPCPAACSACPTTRSGTPEDLAGELEARGEEALLCGDGALRFAAVFAELDRVEFAGIAHAAPSLSALAELAVGRYEREEFCRARRSAADVPAQERRRDLAGKRGAPEWSRCASRSNRSRCTSCRCAGGTCAPVLRIEQQVYPRPWSHSLFVSELALRSTRVVRRRQGRARHRRVRGPDDVAQRRSRHDDRRRSDLAPAPRRHAAAARARARGGRARRDRAHARSRGCRTSPRRRCTGGSASCRSASARATTPTPVRTRS